MTIASIIASAGSEIAYPRQSIDFESSSSQTLQISNANFGPYDRAKCAWSFWIKPESDTGAAIYAKGGTDKEFEIRYSADSIYFFGFDSGGSVNGSGNTPGIIPTGSWVHILTHFDRANATSSERLKIWINGSLQAISSYVAPTADLRTTTNPTLIGNKGSGALYYDGLIYQPAFFSGVLPDISSLYTGGHPRDIRLVPGLYSLLDVSGGVVTSDYLLSGWTQTNTPIASSDIPT